MRSDPPAAAPRVALISVWLGRTRRGFERYFNDLFGVLRGELDITLYKSGGPRSVHQRIPPLLRPVTGFVRALPLGELEGNPRYKRDCLAFGLCLLPELLRNRYDVIHCIDPPLAKVLQRFGRLRKRLLFTEGCVTPPEYYPRVAHVHHVAQVYHRNALDWGIPESHMTLVPCGLHTDRFAIGGDRAELRRKNGISSKTFVILAVSNLDRVFKRVDYIIEEAAGLEGDILLWIDGNPDDPTLLDLAREKLGPRCRITHVDSSEVPDLYRLADVMVHASLSEAFGLAVVEALCSGLPVLAHDCPHFEWLIGDRHGLVDMSAPGNMAARLHQLAAQRKDLTRDNAERAERVRRRFGWSSLVPSYLAMYRKVAALTSPEAVGK